MVNGVNHVLSMCLCLVSDEYTKVVFGRAESGEMKCSISFDQIS